MLCSSRLKSLNTMLQLEKQVSSRSICMHLDAAVHPQYQSSTPVDLHLDALTLSDLSSPPFDPAEAPASCDDLPDDVVLAILSHLNANTRWQVAGTCHRLLDVASTSIKSLSVALPCGSKAAHQTAGLGKVCPNRFDSISHLQLEVPLLNKQQLYNVEDMSYPLNSWLASYLKQGKAAKALTSLKIKAHVPHGEGSADSSPPQSPSTPKDCAAYCSGQALLMLSLNCPNLQRLTLPLMAPSAGLYLPSLQQLKSLNFVVQDCGLIDAAVKLRGLTQLCLATHRNLLYVVLQQGQIEQIAKVSMQVVHAVQMAPCAAPDIKYLQFCM